MWSRPPELSHAHDAGRESSGLVGADDARTAQGLDRRKATDQHVTGGHPLHAHGERNRHDGRQTFGNGRDGKCDCRHEHFDRRQAPQKAGQSDDRDDPGADVQQSSAHTCETALQRCDRLFRRRQQVRDPSELGLHACCDNFRQPGPRRDRRSHEHEVVTIRQRRFRRSRGGRLLDGKTLAGERGFIRSERMSGVQPRVCRDDIACLEDKQITRHDGLRWNDQAMAVADDPRSRRSHRSERCHRALRSMLPGGSR